jgi:transketolase
MNSEEIRFLEMTAKKIRIKIVKMIAKAGSGHPGGSLSIADIMAYLFFKEMNLDPGQADLPERDRFVLSKGHAAPVLYAVLSMKGFFPEGDLDHLRSVSSHLQGHPHRLDTPGVEASTGSLGQGFSMASGMALGNRISGIQSHIFTIIGDGESQEGQIWETAMSAGFRKLSNLCAFLDYNNQQIDGNVSDIKDISPVREKWESFRWNVIEINGHDFYDIEQAVSSFKKEKNKPTMIIARTVKGKGVSFMENNLKFHGTAPDENELKVALEELQNG